MQTNKSKIWIIAILFAVLLAGGLTLALYPVVKERFSVKETTKVDVSDTTFAKYSEEEIFKSVPAMEVEDTQVGESYQYGSSSYTIHVSGTSLEDYQAYLKRLEENGFKKYVDNGKEGMEGYVYNTSFTKDNLTLSVYHIVKFDTTYVTVGKQGTYSEHLKYQDSYMAGATSDAKNKVHLFELSDNGNAYIIELKNGHFIVEDGGNEADAPYLLDYLESLTPGDEKPIIEAWFITHAHGDHSGALKKIMVDQSAVDRLVVNGIYFVDPSRVVQEKVFNDVSLNSMIWFTMNATTAFKGEDGKACQLYRPTLGEKYYFGDIEIDIALTMDQIMDVAYYEADFNDTSTWLMHYIDGQTFLHAGDAAETTTQMAMDFFDKEYFDIDIFSVLHHGINVYDFFTDYCTLDVVLYTSRVTASLYTDTFAARLEENEHLRNSAQECLAHGNGTVVLTFPYVKGTSETKPPCDWRYNDGERPHLIWDVIGGRKAGEEDEE